MKIAFVGKGGSGKTTCSSLFIRFLYESGHPTLAIDADINQHLYKALHIPNLSKPEVQLGYEKELLATILASENRLVTPKTLRVSTPLSEGSHVIKHSVDDPIINKFTSTKRSLHFAEVGEFDTADTNQHCYHFRQKAAEMILNHIISRHGEYTVFDMTAGADSFASGLFGKFDVTVLVVEPTAKSVAVFKQYNAYSSKFDINLVAVGNKIEDQDDEDYIRQEIGADKLIACVPKSKYIKQLERNIVSDWSTLEDGVLKALQEIKNYIDSVEIDYDQIQERYETIHRMAIKGLSNESDLLKQIDDTFSLKELANSLV